MVSVRDVFFNKIYEVIEAGEDIYIVSADLGAPSLDALREKYPQRFINVGIAEQGLISIAAGLVESGKKVIAYGLNPFPATRGYDQIRCLLGELNIPLVICALNVGASSVEAGYTHLSSETFNILRMLPNIEQIIPSDETIAKMLAFDILKTSKPRYISFDKAIKGKIYQTDDINFKKGFTVYSPLKDAKIAIVTNGSFISSGRNIAQYFAKKNISVKLIDLYVLPVDESKLIKEIKECSSIVTLEENTLQGGLGSYILEMLSDNNIYVSVKRHGFNIMNGVFNVFMNRKRYRDMNKLNEADIIGEIEALQ